MKFEPIDRKRHAVAESPFWDAGERRLYWVDIVGKTIHAHDADSGGDRQWSCDDFPTALAVTKNGDGAIVAFSGGVSRLDFASGALTPRRQSRHIGGQSAQ